VDESGGTQGAPRLSGRVVCLPEDCRQERLSRQPSAAVQPPLNLPIKQPGIAAKASL